jgi:hypothetical protein
MPCRYALLTQMENSHTSVVPLADVGPTIRISLMEGKKEMSGISMTRQCVSVCMLFKEPHGSRVKRKTEGGLEWNQGALCSRVMCCQATQWSRVSPWTRIRDRLM